MVPDRPGEVPPVAAPKTRRWQAALWVAFGLILVGVVVLTLLKSKPQPPPVQVALGDGRILQIEKVTYGKHHQVGRGLVLRGQWARKLPPKVKKFLGLDSVSTIDLPNPALVVWINCLDAFSKTNVNCFGLQLQLTNKNGDVFPGHSMRMFSGPGFWRAGYIFNSYPKNEPAITLQAMSFRSRQQVVSVEFSNPQVIEPAQWIGAPLPQTKTVGDVEIVLKSLGVQRVPHMGLFPTSPPRFPSVASPSGRPDFEQMQTRMKNHQKAMEDWQNSRMRWTFLPIGECRQDGKPAPGWSTPEWMAEDPLGNRSFQLGTNQAVLKFFTTVYPKATNAPAVQLLATLPETDLSNLNTNLVWNQKTSTATNEIVVVGLFLAGTHTFSNGVYQSSSATIAPTRGSTGWNMDPPKIVGGRPIFLREHSAQNPVIYLRTPRLTAPGRVAVRLRDADGRYWLTKADMELEAVQPFLLELPFGVTKVTPEVVLLRPIHAEFLVDTKR